jgi:hypothetical protein
MGSLNRWDFKKLDFADLRFAMTRILCQDSKGRQSQRWVPFGMPQLTPELERLVIFMYGRHPQTGKWGLGGSGFLYGYPSDRRGPNHIYAITNWHVAVSSGFPAIRLHGRSDHDFIELGPHDWVCSPNGYDLAVADISDLLDPNADNLVVVDDHMAVSADYAARAEIGFGDDVLMAGMFANSPGDRRNAPVARFGNVARAPNDDAPIKLETGVRLPCYLVDMRSRTGYSGSPVFVYRTLASDLRPMIEGGVTHVSAEKTMFNLLGVHCGQYPEDFKAAKSHARGDPLVEGDEIEGPSAMNVVVPAWAIQDLLNDQRLQNMRTERDKRRAADSRSRPVPESALGPPTKADNPQHKEDFNSLLDAAARKPKPTD